MFLFFLDIKLLYKFKYRGVPIVGILFQYSSGMNIGIRDYLDEDTLKYYGNNQVTKKTLTKKTKQQQWRASTHIYLIAPAWWRGYTSFIKLK